MRKHRGGLYRDEKALKHHQALFDKSEQSQRKKAKKRRAVVTITEPHMTVEIVSDGFAADVEKCSEIHDEPLPPVRDDDGWI